MKPINVPEHKPETEPDGAIKSIYTFYNRCEDFMVLNHLKPDRLHTDYLVYENDCKVYDFSDMMDAFNKAVYLSKQNSENHYSLKFHHIVYHI